MGERSGLIRSNNEEPGLAVTVTAPVNTTVTCQICNHSISLEGKQAQHVVKCTGCNEATPIKAAPAGKKYVRCQCNCLLICKSSGRRISCPRSNCKRIITLEPSSGYGSVDNATANQIFCRCGHCGGVCAVTSNAQLIRCQHCGVTSSVGPHYARQRWLVYLIIGFISCIATGLLIAFTFSKASNGSPGLIGLYSGLIGCSIGLLIRSCCYYGTPVSVVSTGSVA